MPQTDLGLQSWVIKETVALTIHNPGVVVRISGSPDDLRCLLVKLKECYPDLLHEVEPGCPTSILLDRELFYQIQSEHPELLAKDSVLEN